MFFVTLQEAPAIATQTDDVMEEAPAEAEPSPPGPLQRVETQSEASLVRDQSGKELTVMKARGGKQPHEQMVDRVLEWVQQPLLERGVLDTPF